jgi:hypothetical protein
MARVAFASLNDCHPERPQRSEGSRRTRVSDVHDAKLGLKQMSRTIETRPYSLPFSHPVRRRPVCPRNRLVQQAQIDAQLRPVVNRMVENPIAKHAVF